MFGAGAHRLAHAVGDGIPQQPMLQDRCVGRRALFGPVLAVHKLLLVGVNETLSVGSIDGISSNRLRDSRPQLRLMQDSCEAQNPSIHRRSRLS